MKVAYTICKFSFPCGKSEDAPKKCQKEKSKSEDLHGENRGTISTPSLYENEENLFLPS